MATPGPLTERLTLPPGQVDLTAYDPRATPRVGGGKKQGEKLLSALAGPLADLQERLFAAASAGGTRRLLLVLQGMDTSGKGGVVKHAVGLVDPQGVHIASFKAPTRAEKRHDFLWRVERQLPGPGRIGVFDRSHYEDVLIGRVHRLAPEAEIERRYGAINDFEGRLVEAGTVVVKCMLHVSSAEQRARLLARLDDPTKHWKFNPGDVDERALWPAYTEAYEIMLERTNTGHAPWLVVPADRKWYRNLAVATVLREHLEALGLGWPGGDFDVREQKRRLTREGR